MRQDAEIIDVRKMKIVQPVLEIAMKIFQEIMTMTIMIQLIQKIVYAMMEILQIATIDGLINEGCECTENKICGLIDGPHELINPYTGSSNANGICRLGIQLCANGIFDNKCLGAQMPIEEVCDSSWDNDCDYEVDEGRLADVDGDGFEVILISNPYRNSWTEDCDDNDINTYPRASEVCDGKDNDCDGAVDEGCGNLCTPGETRECNTDAGECVGGTQVCSSGRIWDTCKDADGEVIRNKNPGDNFLPIPEICDGKDND